MGLDAPLALQGHHLGSVLDKEDTEALLLENATEVVALEHQQGIETQSFLPAPGWAGGQPIARGATGAWLAFQLGCISSSDSGLLGRQQLHLPLCVSSSSSTTRHFCLRLKSTPWQMTPSPPLLICIGWIDPGPSARLGLPCGY